METGKFIAGEMASSSGMAVLSAITTLQIGATLAPLPEDQVALNKAAEYLLSALAPQLKLFLANVNARPFKVSERGYQSLTDRIFSRWRTLDQCTFLPKKGETYVDRITQSCCSDCCCAEL